MDHLNDNGLQVRLLRSSNKVDLSLRLIAALRNKHVYYRPRLLDQVVWCTLNCIKDKSYTLLLIFGIYFETSMRSFVKFGEIGETD
eukprot:snap_masked-scaffold_2-processed-gene-24.16-mRNA-1 protein AED:1.00 eAED:1.00 QI:0/-1/0/0/-1/1/1/0/85